jgi:glycosyltransferase involved in cell wall biosynthesis
VQRERNRMTAHAFGDARAGFSVVVVSDFGHVTGGAAQVAIQSAIGLRSQGAGVTFVYAVGPVDERLEASGVAVERIPFDEIWAKSPISAALQGIWNGAAAMQISDLLKRFNRRRTIVHFHQWTKCFSPSVLAKSLALGFGTVITMHDYFATCPNGALYNFSTGQPCNLRPLSARCVVSNCDSRSFGHKMVRVARSSAQSLVLSRLAAKPAIIHVSDFARRIAEPYSMDGSRHYTVANPLLLERPERTAAEIYKEFLFVGRLVPEKGCLELARAARRADVPVAFAGSGPMESAIREANPTARLLGWLPTSDLMAIVRKSRALVFPSRWHETSGLVCLEALAHGLPVIASERTAAAGLIETGANGILLDPDDALAFDAALERLRSDETVGYMSRLAYDRYWAAPNSIEGHVAALIDVYRDVVARGEEQMPCSSNSATIPGFS